MRVESNFHAWLSEDGVVVPGSHRHGHNVFTDFGREWLRDLVSWTLRTTYVQGGAAATVIAGAGAGEKRIGGLTGMTSASEGRYLSLGGSGDNDGVFLISSFISVNSVDVVDASPGTIPDANNSSIVWAELEGPGDTTAEQRRLRWIGLGTGSALEITSVDQLASPLSITTGPDVFFKVLGTRTEPVITATKYVTAFAETFAHHGASVDISEAAIFADVHDGTSALLDTAVGTNAPVAYKTFAPLNKLQAQTFTATWEFRF